MGSESRPPRADEASELREAARGLLESEQRFRALFEQAAVGVGLIETATGRFVGLSVVHGIVQEHGGAIDVVSTVGVGTTVVVRLAVAPEATDAAVDDRGALAEGQAVRRRGAQSGAVGRPRARGGESRRLKTVRDQEHPGILGVIAFP